MGGAGEPKTARQAGGKARRQGGADRTISEPDSFPRLAPPCLPLTGQQQPAGNRPDQAGRGRAGPMPTMPSWAIFVASPSRSRVGHCRAWGGAEPGRAWGSRGRRPKPGAWGPTLRARLAGHCLLTGDPTALLQPSPRCSLGSASLYATPASCSALAASLPDGLDWTACSGRCCCCARPMHWRGAAKNKQVNAARRRRRRGRRGRGEPGAKRRGGSDRAGSREPANQLAAAGLPAACCCCCRVGGPPQRKVSRSSRRRRGASRPGAGSSPSPT